MTIGTKLYPVWAAALCGLSSCAVPNKSSDDTYGRVRENAIEVCDQHGEHEYLSKLSCSDGAAFSYRLIGNVGPRTEPSAEFAERLKREDKVLERLITSTPIPPGEPDLHIVDEFEVKCGAAVVKLYLDRYHCPGKSPTGRPLTPRGFQFRAAEPGGSGS